MFNQSFLCETCKVGFPLLQGSVPKLLLEPSTGSRVSAPFSATKTQNKTNKPKHRDTPTTTLTMWEDYPSSSSTSKHVRYVGMKWVPSNFNISVPSTSSDVTQKSSASKSANKSSSSVPSASSSSKSSSSQNKKQSSQLLKQKNKSTVSPLRVSAQPRISFRASKIPEMVQDTMTTSELKLPEVRTRCRTSLDHTSGPHQHSWS